MQVILHENEILGMKVMIMEKFYILSGVLWVNLFWLTKTITRIPCFLVILILVIETRTKRNRHPIK